MCRKKIFGPVRGRHRDHPARLYGEALSAKAIVSADGDPCGAVTELRDRNMVVAMPRELQLLTFTAIGDAYGVCFEYAPREIIRTRNNLAGYFHHHKYQTGGGRYSDDTQMSIAVAEALLKFGNAASAHDFTASFVAAFQRDPREGYAGRF
jgi:hypothetical protein